MIEKLRAAFPSLIIEKTLPTNMDRVYFRLDNGMYIGISKEELSEKDQTLLSIFMSPIAINHHLTVLQSMWQQLLFTNHSESLVNLQDHYDPQASFRMIHFHLHHEVDKQTFEEALSSLSIIDSTVIWISSTDGVIMEQIKQEKITTEELIDLRNAIASDFYTDSFFFIGNSFTLSESIKDRFEWESRSFPLARNHLKNKGVYQFFELFPYLLLREVTEDTKERVQQLIQDYSEEELQTIKTFIENGLNLSLTAKKLFMHRNSLQYRVDKFIEKTGIDIKSFHGAVVVYLALLAIEE